jgi:uncharacterized protein involved in high-affinity Fe2+ transport
MPLFALVLSLAVIPAQAAVIGGPLLREGLEIVPSLASSVQLERTPASMSKAADAVFLIADVHATRDEAHGFAEHAFIPYLSISYVLTKEGAPTFKQAGLLYPTASKDGPHYAAGINLNGPGDYHLIYLVSPPSSHGMIRETGKDRGVPDWWKPFNAAWNFTYPASNTVSAK